MIKKILITTLLWLGLTAPTFAKDVDFDGIDLNTYQENTLTVSTGITWNGFNPNQKDWIGIYKEGDSTEWKNVKLWTWAKNLKYIEEGMGMLSYRFENLNLPTGKYVARYFLNNTYDTRLESEPCYLTSSLNKIEADYSPDHIRIMIQNKDFKPNQKDWIGLYKKGDSNDWNNVKAWVWAKKLQKTNHYFSYNFNNINLPEGTYVARYFLNNTYITNYESNSFKVPKNYYTLDLSFDRGLKIGYLELDKKNFKPNPKDWIGLYRKGDSNDWNNVKAWVWVKDIKKYHNVYRYEFKNLKLPHGLYEVRYFLNNTFITDKTSRPTLMF